MSKSTNKLQLQHLLSLLEQSPEIARSFFKGDKQLVQQFWRRVEDELNSLGPPTKNSTEWKKVWNDQKKYVRQKAAQNLQNQKATGGGPNREYKFSPTEQIIFDLIGMTMEKLKSEELEEMRRHHSFMEEMRVKEVEYKLEKNRYQLDFFAKNN